MTLYNEKYSEPDVLMDSLALMLAYRDRSNGAHNRRTGRLITVMARAYGQITGHPFSDQVIRCFYQSAPLHDIGKIAIPDAVLMKPGPLSCDEFAMIRKHTAIGSEILRQIQRLSGNRRFLRFAIEMAECHHEHYDGSGYPRGLRGDAIPISAQLMAAADVYDALVTDRPYRRAMTHETAVEILLSGDDRTQPTHFSQRVLCAFEQSMVIFRKTLVNNSDEMSA